MLANKVNENMDEAYDELEEMMKEGNEREEARPVLIAN